mgnify:FL=1
MENLIFLKLGGSLITDKMQPRTLRPETLKALTAQLATVRAHDPNLLLLLGHGSGSFGHVPAKKYKTREGLQISPQPSSLTPLPQGEGNSRPVFVKNREGRGGGYWHGFTEVWHEAAALNKHVMDALREADNPAMAMPPSASVMARDGKVVAWNLAPIKRALLNGILPVVHGDVIFDELRGGTILSTEDLFMHLARELRPQRILLAGLEDGIYADFPARKHKVARVTPTSFHQMQASIGASAATDVTGGMDSKVRQMLRLVDEIPELSVQIFSGEVGNALKNAFKSNKIGTLITSN